MFPAQTPTPSAMILNGPIIAFAVGSLRLEHCAGSTACIDETRTVAVRAVSIDRRIPNRNDRSKRVMKDDLMIRVRDLLPIVGFRSALDLIGVVEDREPWGV